jgi:type I restriction enzyme M protein
MATFAEAKTSFDIGPGRARELDASLVPVDGKAKKNISIRNAKGEPLEEFYKWQFIYGLIYSGLYAKDYIGAEVRFPKGSKASAPLRLDGAIFDDPAWLQHYNDYWQHHQSQDLEWLNARLLAVIEFKRDDKGIEKVFTRQVKPAMKERDPATAYVVGMYYDRERLYLFHRRDGLFLRYDEAKNQKGKESKIGDLSLHLPDPYSYIPSFDDLFNRVHRPLRLTAADALILISMSLPPSLQSRFKPPSLKFYVPSTRPGL